MKEIPIGTRESEFDLHALAIGERAIDAIELTDEELGQATGSQFGFGGFGFGFPGFGFGFPGFGFGFPGFGFPGFGFGGFAASFTSFAGSPFFW
jgi:hypothetical protein